MEVKGSKLRLMRNLYDGEHTRTHTVLQPAEGFSFARDFFLNVFLWAFQQLRYKFNQETLNVIFDIFAFKCLF